VLPVTKYVAETLTLTKKSMKKLQVAKRAMTDIYRTYHKIEVKMGWARGLH